MLERKGVQHLLAALADFETDYKVVIVGDGPFLPTLKKRAEQKGVKVSFTGFLQNDSEQLLKLSFHSRL